MLESVFFGESMELLLDRNRRLTILVSTRYRRALNLGDTIVAVGHGETFQIWKPTVLKKSKEGALDWIDDLEGFDPLSLLDVALKPKIAT